MNVDPEESFSEDITVPDPSRTKRASAIGGRGVEVRYVLGRQPPEAAMVEVWTAHHVYYVDAAFELIWVLSRRSGHGRPPQRLAGARLCGGELHNARGEIVAVYQPVPVPQAIAVFERRCPEGLSVKRTSPVQRVVLRVHEIRTNAPTLHVAAPCTAANPPPRLGAEAR